MMLEWLMAVCKKKKKKDFKLTLIFVKMKKYFKIDPSLRDKIIKLLEENIRNVLIKIS